MLHDVLHETLLSADTSMVPCADHDGTGECQSLIHGTGGWRAQDSERFKLDSVSGVGCVTFTTPLPLPSLFPSETQISGLLLE